MQDLQDILEKPVPDEEDEELESKHPDELEVLSQVDEHPS